MAVTVAELTTEGIFKLAGNLNTRQPTIIDGVVVNFPFDGTEISSDGLISPTINTNNTFTYDGVAVETTTTNIVTNPLTFDTWTSTPSLVTILDDTFSNEHNTFGAISYIQTSEATDIVYLSNPSFSVSTNDIITVSFYAKKVKGSGSLIPVDVNAYNIDLDQVNVTPVSADISVIDDQEWHRYFASFLISGAGAVTAQVSFYHENSGHWNIDYLLSLPQVEFKEYPTSFIAGSRGAGDLALTSTLFPQINGAIIVTARTAIPSGTTTKIFSNENSSNGNAIILNGSNAVIFNSGGELLNTTVTNIKDWNTYGYRVNADSSVSCFINGIWVGDISTTIYTNRLNFRLGKDTNGSYLSSIEIKNLLIYDRLLSDEEIFELSTKAFELTITGDCITPQVATSPDLPSDAYYFPLGFDTKDLYKVISPLLEEGTSYEDSFIWSGESITNDFTNYTTAIFQSAYDGANYGFGVSTNLQQEDINEYKLIPTVVMTKVSRILGGISQRDYVLREVGSGVGTTKIISFWYYGTYGTTITPYNSDSSATLYYMLADGSWSSGSTSIIIPVIENEWQRIIIKMVNSGTAGTGLTWIALHSNNFAVILSNSEYWMFTGWQVETSLYPTPFIAGTRLATTIKYDDMKITPQFSAINPITLFIAFKIHPAVDTSANAYLFSCTDDAGFSLHMASTGTLSADVHNGTSYSGTDTIGTNYKDYKIHIATMVIGADDVILYLDGEEEARTIGHMTGKSIYYGSGSYNFFIGANNVSGVADQQFNGYLRDFICIPQELSSEEIVDIAKTKMEVLTNTRISGNIQTELTLL